MLSRTLFAFAIVLGTSNLTVADEAMTVGGDRYLSGANAKMTEPSSRDAFVAGFSARLAETVAGDAHLTGMSVSVDAPVAGDLYANGFTVDIESGIGSDVSAIGFNISIGDEASVTGNARLSGANVSVEAPVEGSVLVAAGAFELDAPVSGDVRLVAGSIEFGDNARIGGNLVYQAPRELDIPESVVPAGRVTYEKLSVKGGAKRWRDSFDMPGKSLWPSILGGFLALVGGLVFLTAVAAALLALMPDRVERLRRETIARPWSGLAFGAIGLATLVGLVPVAGMTLIGIPLIPIVLIAIAILWTIGYLLGAYSLAWRIVGAFRELEPTLVTRLVVAIAGVIVLAILNFIPFVGWLINFAVVLLGLGALAAMAVTALASWRESQPVHGNSGEETSTGNGNEEK